MRGSDGPWTAKDFLLTHAHTLYQHQLCTECGRPLSVCRRGPWEVETRQCGPTAAIGQWRKENPDPEPGTVLSTVEQLAMEATETWATVPDWVREKYGDTTA